MEHFRSLMALGADKCVYRVGGRLCMAVVGLHDPDLCGWFYGAFRGCDGGGEHRRGLRICEIKKYHHAAYDVFYNNLSVLNSFTGIYGV